MKKFSITFAACLLALMITILSPLRAIAAAGSGTEEYISEVKIGMGKDAAAAAAALKGYKILSDKSGNIDLNFEAGGGLGSKGEKVVYLGYKTTNDRKEAITDLAVMNMKGGYSVDEYDILFESYIKSQIEPMVSRFVDAFEEYRANFGSKNESNRNRAAYIHNVLNKFIDDDTGKGLGDLLLNRTKYEIGDEAYDALSEAQKKNTADIVTIIAQSNGKATLMMENLIVRAADTSDDTWLDRFAATTYDDLLDEICDERGLLPSDAEAEAARLYEDDARKVRAMWNYFYSDLAGYDEAVELLESYDSDAVEKRLTELDDFISGFDRNKNTEEELAEAIEEQLKLITLITEAMNAAKTVTVYEYLEQTGYGDGTLLDFFNRSSREVDLTELYPLAASFSDGQRAGLDFISLIELIIIALTDGTDYSDNELDRLDEASIYDGVDRGIYQKGGVGLTTKARRDKALEEQLAANDDDRVLSDWTHAAIALTGASFLAFIVSASEWTFNTANIISMRQEISMINKALTKAGETLEVEGLSGEEIQAAKDLKSHVTDLENNAMPTAVSNATMYKYLTIGLGVAVVILIGISVYLSYRDMVEHYNVEFTPIPHYMVDEKDITAYNAKGEKIFIKNQSAYYKAVECNRTSADEMYDKLGTCSDLNGDVGEQWLALYAVKNEAMAPILADSLKAVNGDDKIPANYTTGIHMFGSDTAFDLNDHMYVWNDIAPSVYVYFNTDNTAKKSAAGSIFADGNEALAGGIGIIIGALAACAVTLAIRKKKERETVATV